ncbi:MAG: YcjF family protein [Bacteroides sp.]|nr:YcjF family protein [Bacteroides sp.]
MKRNVVLLIIAIVAIVVVILMGNIILIGDKLMNLHVYVGYAFYLVLLGLLFWLVVLPLLRIMNAPSTPALHVKNLPTEKDELYKYGLLIARNSRHIENAADRRNHQKALLRKLENGNENTTLLAEIITEEINHRMKLIDASIRERALSILIITALSQNGRFDFITSIIINFRLIHEIVRLSGFRPTYAQLVRLYFEVLLASFITDLSEGFLEEIDFSAILNSVNIPAVLLRSAMDGGLSALMTMRIGYVTKSYIRKGTARITSRKENEKLRKEARREAIRMSVKAFPALAKEGFTQIKNSSFKAVGGFFRNLF